MAGFNTTKTGSGFDLLTIKSVWEKAIVVPGKDARLIRKDRCGAWIKRAEYGQTTDCGWEIDHIKPQDANGGDELSNLQPLHWKNNRTKGSDWPASPASYCVVTAR